VDCTKDLEQLDSIEDLEQQACLSFTTITVGVSGRMGQCTKVQFSTWSSGKFDGMGWRAGCVCDDNGDPRIVFCVATKGANDHQHQQGGHHQERHTESCLKVPAELKRKKECGESVLLIYKECWNNLSRNLRVGKCTGNT